MKSVIQTPTTLSQALRLAAELAERNEDLEKQLTELRMNREYPEVLRPAHITKLMSVSKSKVSEWANDPTFPLLNRERKKGEVISVLKSDFYHWLKTRNKA
jgi:hypothetical protein